MKISNRLTIQNHHETPWKSSTMAPHSMMGALSVWAEMMKGVKPSQSRWPRDPNRRVVLRLIGVAIFVFLPTSLTGWWLEPIRKKFESVWDYEIPNQMEVIKVYKKVMFQTTNQLNVYIEME